MLTLAEELKKNPEMKESDLKLLKDWIEKQPHLPQNIPDEMVALILHSCYYSVEFTKITIDNYFTLRTHLPEFFNHRDISRPELQEAFDTMNILPLTGRTREGYKVIMMELKRTDPQFYNLAESFKLFNMVLEVCLQREGSFPGLIIVVSYTGLKMGHLAKLTLPLLKKVFTYLQDGMPVRLKGLHYINIVPLVDKIMTLSKPFLKKELLEMLVLHPEGSDSIYKIVPKEVFPNEYGGAGGPNQEIREKTYKLLQEFTPWFMAEEQQMRVSEEKRIGKAKSAGDIFGMEGSFRKLDLD